MHVLFTVQKRGEEFWVVTTSDIKLTKEYGPFATAALANAEADTQITALEATRNSTADLNIHADKFPV